MRGRRLKQQTHPFPCCLLLVLSIPCCFVCLLTPRPMTNTLVFGVCVGAIALLSVELLFSLFFYCWFSGRRGRVPPPPKRHNCCHDNDDERSLPIECHKQGIVWVLESTRVPEVNGNGAQANETKEEKDITQILEVYPVLKHAKIKNHKLILTDPEDSFTTIVELSDCAVLAVSASDLPARKWANRYPIKLESKSAAIYEGSKICYLYLDTSWEKESWCKALSFASCPDKQKIRNYAQLREDFQRYAASVPEQLSPQKPFQLYSNVANKATKFHKTTRIRYLLNRFARGMAKNSIVPSSHGKKKGDERSVASNGGLMMNEFLNASSPDKSSSGSLQDVVQPSSLPPAYAGTKIQPPGPPNAACDDNFNHDDSAFFWNLVISRLFFDIKRSTMVNNYIKTQIQRTLSSMKFPGFFGRVECAALDIGDLPPHIHKVKVVNKDMSEVLTAEIDVEYSGGISFAFEVRQLGCNESGTDTNLELNSRAEMDTDHPEELQDNAEQMAVLDNSDEPEQLESTTWKTIWSSTWKAIKDSVVDHVPQVPLSVSVKVSSFNGTLRLHIKPPPSDQLWFGFTSMPEMDWNFVSAVGGQRINIGAITSLFKNLFENAIRESLVSPNCECICIPWMLDEKDNWLPMTEAPFQWINQETFADVTELSQETTEVNQEPPMDLTKLNFMEVTELKASETDQSHEVATSHVSPAMSCQFCRTPNILDHTVMQKYEETQGSRCSTPLISPGEMVSWEKATVTTETEEDPSTKKKLNVKGLKKMVGETIEGQKRHIGNMVGVSLKKCEKVKMHNIFGRHAPTARSLQQ